MGQESIKRTIILDGKTGTGFTGMIAKIQSFSDAVEQIGQKATELLSNGLDTYKDYETNMLEAQFALSAQIRDVNELNKAMDTLEDSAQKWAESTIFHTDDVSKAISEAAHAGWDLDEILTGIPQAMLIAQAGGLDLSEGLDYLIKMINGTGSSFEDAGTIVDQWAMAANSSATTIEELGQAFIAMGASAQFGDSTAELFTMLGTLANVGMTGSQAGTALRNAIVRLIAPTTKADAAMSILGADASEIQEALSDESVTKAAKTLEGLGFSAYKSNGDLKPLKDVFSELYDITQGLDEASRNEIIAAIFPTRTISTALALLEAAKNDYNGLYESITNSEGYAQSGAEIMMSGLKGSTELLASKWEEFQRKIGEFSAPEVEKLNSALGGILNSMNEWPSETWNGFVGGLEALAIAGGTAGAIKTVTTLTSMLGPWGTIAVVASFALGAMVGYLNELDRINWEDKFGQMDLDIEALNGYLEGVNTKWEVEQKTLEVWSDAINKTLEEYETASSKLSEMLMTDVITGKELTQEDKDAIGEYFKGMYASALAGVQQAKQLSLEELGFTLDTANADQDAVGFLQALVTGYYGDLEGQMKETGYNLGKALADAMEDGAVTLDEQKIINDYIQKMNEIEAKIAEATRKRDYYKTLRKAQNVSWESADEFVKDTAAKRNEALQSIEDEFEDQYADMMNALDWAYESGEVFHYFDNAGVKHYARVRDEDDYEYYKGLIKGIVDEAEAKSKAEESAKFNEPIREVVNQLLSGSEMGEGWKFLTDYLAGGEELDWAKLGAEGAFSYDKLDKLQELYGSAGKLIDILSNISDDPTVQSWIQTLEEGGGIVDKMREFEHYRQRYISSGGLEDPDNIWSTPEEREARVATNEQKEILQAQLADYNAQVENYKKKYNGELGWIEKAQKDAIEIQNRLDANEYQNDAFWWLGGNTAEDKRRSDERALAEALAAYEDSTASANEYQSQIETYKRLREGAEKELADLQADVKLFPDTSQFNESTLTFTGTVLLTPKISYTPTIPTDTFAEGGRATEPSIFGEVPGQAEWAIPEAHDDRTADLLNAARQASGFTWSELIARNGGLNGGGGGSVVIENYAPVINANDATGVAAVLEEDKERLKKAVREAMRESRMIEDARVYA